MQIFSRTLNVKFLFQRTLGTRPQFEVLHVLTADNKRR